MFGVRLRYKKDPQWGQVIEEIADKIYEIVGVKNEEEYRIISWQNKSKNYDLFINRK
ncbi:MAG: hypothetical protein ACFFE5_09845 [Candidatus Thorarchaeota archaeon]